MCWTISHIWYSSKPIPRVLFKKFWAIIRLYTLFRCAKIIQFRHFQVIPYTVANYTWAVPINSCTIEPRFTHTTSVTVSIVQTFQTSPWHRITAEWISQINVSIAFTWSTITSWYQRVTIVTWTTTKIFNKFSNIYLFQWFSNVTFDKKISSFI